MKSKKLIIRVICIVLAVLILGLAAFLVISNLNKKPTKKKKVIKKVVVVQDDPVDTPTLPGDFDITEDPDSVVDGTYERVRRKLTLKTNYQAPDYVPEYAVTEADWAGPEGYVIVASKDVRASRDSAKRVQQYFLEKTGITIPCVTDETPQAAKEILVGDTNRRTSSLKDTEFAVKLEGDTLVIEGGHFAMTDTAVDWFISFDYKAGKVNLLTGEIKDFLPSVTVEGHTLNYVWGDEHGGNKLNRLKWGFNKEMGDNSDAEFIMEEYPYLYIAEGQLKIVSGRYYNMYNTSKTYQTNVSVTSKNQMSYIFGYCEINAMIPYYSGSWPSYWFLSRGALRDRYNPTDPDLPTYSLFIEIDFIEVTGNKNTNNPNLHKWYKSTSERKAATGENHTSWGMFPLNGKIIGKTFVDGYKASKEFMVHGMYWDAEQMSFYCNGEKYWTFDLTYNFDGPDYDNDAAYHWTDNPIYPIINNSIQTPGSSTHYAGQIKNEELPFEYFLDYSRYYQEQGVGELNLAVEEY